MGELYTPLVGFVVTWTRKRCAPLTPCHLCWTSRTAASKVIRTRELAWPSAAAVLRRAGPALHIGSKVELTLDVAFQVYLL